MATMTVRGTYALDVESVRKLEQLAKKWGVSKSEALRRSIHSAASNQLAVRDRLQAFRALQQSLGLTKSRAAKWEQRVRAERRSSSAKRLRNR